MKRYIAAAISIFLLISCTPTIGEPTVVPTQTPLPATSLPTHIPTATNTPAVGDIALSHVDAISNGIGPRPAGTDKEAETRQYLIKAFEKLRMPSEVYPFTVVVKGKKIESANVVAVKYGALSQEIIVGAHYDSVNVGKGADDNATGVAVILEVAERIANIETPYTVRFILFGAEEVGLKGSQAYVAAMTDEQKQKTIAMINLDSVTAGDFAYIYGDEGEKGAIRDWALQFAAENNLELQTQTGENPEYPAGTTGDWSDHAPFKAAGIQYAYLESTNWTLGDKDGYTQVDPQYGEDGEIWHTPFDTLEYIHESFPGRMQERLQLFVTVLEAILTKYQVQ